MGREPLTLPKSVAIKSCSSLSGLASANVSVGCCPVKPAVVYCRRNTSRLHGALPLFHLLFISECA